MNVRLMIKSLLAVVFALVMYSCLSHPGPVHAAPINHFPVIVTQPDGSVLHLFTSGDEYYNWLQDENQFTVLQDPASGFYVYARLQQGKLVPGPYMVGKADPAALGLQPGLNLSADEVNGLRAEALTQSGTQLRPDQMTPPLSGNVTNLVVFVRFAGEAQFTKSVASYTTLFNSTSSGTSSLKNYFLEASYNALNVNSKFYPSPTGSTILSYQDNQPRSYYQPYNAVTNRNGYMNMTDRTNREYALVKKSVNYVNSLGQFPAAKTIDSNLDGYVDSLTLVISNDSAGRGNLLWPHQWPLINQNLTINNKQVYEYNIQMDAMLNVGVLAHEFFHALGAPELYHYSNTTLRPVGPWDVMAEDAAIPQHMGCYMKYKYGKWIPGIPEITVAGTYTLNPLTSETNNCFLLKSPNSSSEFFILEYRQKSGTFESSLPGSGLLVYRINTTRKGNAGGPPDEVYIYRPNGTPNSNGTVANAFFSSASGRTAINDSTNPSSFLTDGTPGGLKLCNIGPAGNSISFDFCGQTILHNDDFAQPETILGLPVTFSQDVNSMTSTSDDPLLCTSTKGSHTLWFDYTPTVTQTLRIDTFGSNYDTVLQIWKGTRGALTSVACNNDSTSTLQSLVKFTASAGTTYHIEVASKTSTAGKLLLHASPLVTRTFQSVGSQDGEILESSENSGVGGSMRPGNAPAFWLGDDASNRQYRSILSFDTSSLPDNAVVTSIQIKMYVKAKQGIDPFKTLGSILLDIRKPYFGSSASLEIADFQAPASLSPAGWFNSTSPDGWYTTGFINTLALASVNPSGPTQFRLRFSLDDNNNSTADALSFYSGDYSLSTYRPMLIVTYYLP